MAGLIISCFLIKDVEFIELVGLVLQSSDTTLHIQLIS
jgi:hypothetical protein